MLGLILGLGSVLCALLVVITAARRYEARQRRRGKWDEYGPLVETEPPPRVGLQGQSMSERTEVVGKWHGKVLRRRKPHEKP
jgi:hypothetical protein